MSTEPAADRLEVWKHKLLDLSLRNRLLNFRPGRRALLLADTDLGRLEDALQTDRTFELIPAPAAPPQQAVDATADTTDDARGRALAAGRLVTAVASRDELEDRLLRLWRAARLSLEETGAHTLYLALGFLRWFETEESTVERRAPVLLLPVELVRSTVRGGFRLRAADEDPRFNVTLLQKLKVDYATEAADLDTLPEDEAGLAVPAILDRLRALVARFPRWQVADEAAIDLFSFTKFMMWLDLEAHGTSLRRHPVVAHLADTPDRAFPQAPPRLEDPDAQLAAATTFCPLLADGSQLEAVHAAAEGRSFVLEGPPGTGKSQTITNLIAQCLAAGKRVLFVAEKMAALEVVERRLHAVGLGEFCLELFSSKASKKQVLAQMQAALDLVPPEPPGSEWDTAAAELQAARADLDDYCKVLHRRRPLGLSAFDGLARAIGRRDAKRVALALGGEDAVSAEGFAAMRGAADALVAAAASIGPLPGHPLRHVWVQEWDRARESRLFDLQRRLVDLTRGLRDATSALLERLGIGVEADAASQALLAALSRYARLLLARAAPAPGLFETADWAATAATLRAWIEAGRKRDALRAELFAACVPGLLELDLDDLMARLRRAAASVWPLSWLRARAPLALLQPMLRRPLSGTDAAIDLVRKAIELRIETAALRANTPEATVLLATAWRDGDADWGALAVLVDWADDLQEALGALRRAGGEPARHQVLAVTGAERDAELTRFGADTERFAEALASFSAVRDEWALLLALDTGEALGSEAGSGHLARVAAVAEGIAGAAAHLRSFAAYNRARTAALACGLTPVLAALEAGEVAAGEAMACFEASFFDWWSQNVIAAEPRLQRFSGAEHEHRIERFRDLDRALLELVPRVLQARLAERLPRLDAQAASAGEVGLLQRQLKLQRRHLPIRRLLKSIPNLLPRLKPCLLMSPLSVAQFLDVSLPPFDLVVFDEASQIPVWDAVGAIARGAQLVVVGDSRQLPPTTFFLKTLGAEADDEPREELVVEELESVLDECGAARLPRLDLRWHYRSRHESLIAFSNRHYYDNRLFTFPSAQARHPELGVSFRHVADGVYDRSATATNRREAEVVVAEVVRHVRAQDGRSLGVVTFSRSQQALVEDLLEKARRADAALDALLARDLAEPLFVKNLENVQGDERDVILLSVCYGPDAAGKVTMNFGPLNQAGGERRLNVAVTRARRQVIVFSTLTADRIDPDKVGEQAVGVHHLKEFLDYARHGPAALARAEFATPDEPSAFERDVRRCLEADGFTVEAQVGSSGYRIDLAVIDPDDPGRYLLGIECDGAAYRGARTARDRDRLRRLVLEGLGWTLHRIWSTDWLYENARELDRLRAVLAACRERAAQVRAAGTAAAPASIEPAATEPATETATEAAPEEPTEAPPGAATEPVSHRERPVATEPEPSPVREAAPAAELPSGPARVYTTVALDPIGTADDFFDMEQSQRVAAALRAILEAEAPISLALLLRRVGQLWDIGRLTARVQQRVGDLLQAVQVRFSGEDEQAFVWRQDQDPASYAGYRVPAADGQGRRESSDLPAVEIANAAHAILERSISVRRDELIKATARVFGIPRAGRRVVDDFGRGLDLLGARGKASQQGDLIVLQA